MLYSPYSLFYFYYFNDFFFIRLQTRKKTSFIVLVTRGFVSDYDDVSNLVY